MVERVIEACVLPTDPAKACFTLPELRPYLPAGCTVTQQFTRNTCAILWLPNLAAGNMAAELAQVLAEAEDVGAAIRMIHLPMTGVDDYLDLIRATANSRQTTAPIWCCAQGAYARPVAEHALSLLLALYRGLHLTATTQTRSLCDGNTNVFLIGNGSISQALQSLLAPFECSITASSSRTARVDFQAMLMRADVVVVCCPLTDHTRGIINASTLSLLKASAVLINVARGDIVDTGALLNALDNGRLAAAGLDVVSMSDELMQRRIQSLQQAGKLLVTPHSALPTASMQTLLRSRLCHNLDRLRMSMLTEQAPTLLGVVQPDRGY